MLGRINPEELQEEAQPKSTEVEKRPHRQPVGSCPDRNLRSAGGGRVRDRLSLVRLSLVASAGTGGIGIGVVMGGIAIALRGVRRGVAARFRLQILRGVSQCAHGTPQRKADVRQCGRAKRLPDAVCSRLSLRLRPRSRGQRQQRRILRLHLRHGVDFGPDQRRSGRVDLPLWRCLLREPDRGRRRAGRYRRRDSVDGCAAKAERDWQRSGQQ
mmetsp:Transcript_14057/g.41175  ORF Transcript_14057/g.41175 Transcript_14057/m.41175 type:complete len:213 (+) Transcript_14057:554-1192(+)